MLPSEDAETDPGRDGMCEVRETRKGELLQVHGWSVAVVRCAYLRNVSGATGPKSSGTSCFALRML